MSLGAIFQKSRRHLQMPIAYRCDVLRLSMQADGTGADAKAIALTEPSSFSEHRDGYPMRKGCVQFNERQIRRFTEGVSWKWKPFDLTIPALRHDPEKVGTGFRKKIILKQRTRTE
jgi:hypothetical protein